MLDRFTKADPGVEDDTLSRNPGVQRFVELHGQEIPHLTGHVLVTRFNLHRSRRPLHVHEHHRNFFGRGQ